MAQHKVEFAVPKRELGNSNIEFKVWRDGDLLGTLKVSKGAVVWTPANHEFGYKLGWAKFGELMEEEGREGRHS